MPEKGIRMNDMRALLAKQVAFNHHYLQAATAVWEAGLEYVPIGRR